MRAAVYCYGVKLSGYEGWQFVYKRYKNEKIASEAEKLIESLACTNEPWLLQRFEDKIDALISSIESSFFTYFELNQIMAFVKEKGSALEDSAQAFTIAMERPCKTLDT
ncbi:ANPEP [Bugula neritina]|uniref:ANPEP n=1 Tax=Bugula neritina TaxID=10212 RepID=A0A7J7JAD2_BUGNE|nr:ANPEP [Bugula neritina]